MHQKTVQAHEQHAGVFSILSVVAGRGARFAVSQHARNGSQLGLGPVGVVQALKRAKLIFDIAEEQVDARLLLCHGAGHANGLERVLGTEHARAAQIASASTTCATVTLTGLINCAQSARTQSPVLT